MGGQGIAHSNLSLNMDVAQKSTYKKEIAFIYLKLQVKTQGTSNISLAFFIPNLKKIFGKPGKTIIINDKE